MKRLRSLVLGLFALCSMVGMAQEAEADDTSHGDHSLQDCFQSQAGEGVRLYDSYFWLVIHHKSMDS